jgi:NTP pyrophosphatase (non-canonical NTP hydrolase)
MTPSEYQNLASQTMNDTMEHHMELLNYAIGLGGEVGEILEPIKKHVFHGHDLDELKLKAEIGDCIWYLSAIATLNMIDLNDILEYNIQKLRARYPQGFSEEASRRRDD